jgi:Xaa-Pro aminopeptidase
LPARASSKIYVCAKDEDEVAVIRHAVKIIDECFDHICGVMKPGMTEREVADELLRQMRARAASGSSFETIVASGQRGALPHGIASDKKLAAGEMVTIDMGAVFKGYCSDCTRTVALGKVSRQQQKIYETVWQAQTEAAAALKPGLSCKAADAVARKVIDEAGYGQYFGHGLGPRSRAGDPRTASPVEAGQGHTEAGHDGDLRAGHLHRRRGRRAH